MDVGNKYRICLLMVFTRLRSKCISWQCIHLRYGRVNCTKGVVELSQWIPKRKRYIFIYIYIWILLTLYTYISYSLLRYIAYRPIILYPHSQQPTNFINAFVQSTRKITHDLNWPSVRCSKTMIHFSQLGKKLLLSVARNLADKHSTTLQLTFSGYDGW